MNETLSIEDAQIIQRIARQDRQALAQLYDRYAGVLYGTAARILRTPEEAAQVLEEVFLQIWEEAGTFDSKWSRPFHWALDITRQKAISRLEAQKRRYSFVEEVSHETAATVNERPGRPDEYPGRELSARIHAAVQSLPLEQRQAIELAFLGGLSQNEIVQVLGQPAPTIKTRIRHGLLSLRQSMKGTS
jgi:RNA polymerase sigma-70 factor (ECF subfamily)